MGQVYEKAKLFSEDNLRRLRAAVKPHIPADAIVATFGSYARREASALSDIDYIIISNDPESLSKPSEEVEEAIKSIVDIEPSPDGAFGKVIQRSDILKNLGGEQDSNQSLTRRLLLLLEGEWLAGEAHFNELRRQLIERYVAATKRDHQLALFLLNDTIRYWRTMTVDYMYKTTEASKPWAIRNIKLVFSRKLMYASGLFSVAMTADRSETDKVDILEKLFSMPALDRMGYICGDARFSNAFSCYELFLSQIDSADVRERLKKIDADDHSDAVFRKLKNEGHHFTRELLSLFEQTFHSTHPIRRAVMF